MDNPCLFFCPSFLVLLNSETSFFCGFHSAKKCQFSVPILSCMSLAFFIHTDLCILNVEQHNELGAIVSHYMQLTISLSFDLLFSAKFNLSRISSWKILISWINLNFMLVTSLQKSCWEPKHITWILQWISPIYIYSFYLETNYVLWLSNSS